MRTIDSQEELAKDVDTVLREEARLLLFVGGGGGDALEETGTQ